MSEALAVVSHLARVAGKICPVLLKRHFTEERLNGCLRFEVPSSGDGLVYYFSNQEGRCWLDVTNTSAFDLTLDRMILRVLFDGGAAFDLAHLLPEKIPHAGQRKIFIRSASPMLLDSARQARAPAAIEIRGYAIFSIRSFAFQRQIAGCKNASVANLPA